MRHLATTNQVPVKGLVGYQNASKLCAASSTIWRRGNEHRHCIAAAPPEAYQADWQYVVLSQIRCEFCDGGAAEYNMAQQH